MERGGSRKAARKAKSAKGIKNKRIIKKIIYYFQKIEILF
jgi:hypothetical protein